MSAGRVDRAAWAREVADLLQRFAGANKSRFSRQIGFTTRTIDRWLKQEVVVKVETVTAVAERLDMSPLELLGRIGYYGTAAPVPPTVLDPREDPVIQRIMADPRWNEAQRAELVQLQIERMRADEQRRLADYEWMLKQQEHRDAS